MCACPYQSNSVHRSSYTLTLGCTIFKMILSSRRQWRLATSNKIVMDPNCSDSEQLTGIPQYLLAELTFSVCMETFTLQVHRCYHTFCMPGPLMQSVLSQERLSIISPAVSAPTRSMTRVLVIKKVVAPLMEDHRAQRMGLV